MCSCLIQNLYTSIRISDVTTQCVCYAIYLYNDFSTIWQFVKAEDVAMNKNKAKLIFSENTQIIMIFFPAIFLQYFSCICLKFSLLGSLLLLMNVSVFNHWTFDSRRVICVQIVQSKFLADWACKLAGFIKLKKTVRVWKERERNLLGFRIGIL